MWKLLQRSLKEAKMFLLNIYKILFSIPYISSLDAYIKRIMTVLTKNRVKLFVNSRQLIFERVGKLASNVWPNWSPFSGQFNFAQMTKINQKSGWWFQTFGKLRLEAQYSLKSTIYKVCFNEERSIKKVRTT